MRPALLDPTYRARAVPAGSARHWSWLFAAPEARAPLLGVFALCAEWRALYAPGTEPAVAHLKLAWWRDEIERLSSAAPLHPVSRYLAALPGASGVNFRLLSRALDAADAEVSGVPLERGSDVLPHAAALWGDPLALASQLTQDGAGGGSLADIRSSTGRLAAGAYLSAACRGYRTSARAGRTPFAVEDLLSAGVESADLCAERAPPRLAEFLEHARSRSIALLEDALDSLRHARDPGQRHLSVLGALALERARSHPAESTAARRNTRRSFVGRRLGDMLTAWTAARGAQR